MERLRTSIVTQGKVCPDPNRPCEGFKPHELSFAIAQPFKFDRGRDRSPPFFAVILKSGKLCGIDDTERVKAQQQFPAAKVFLHRYMCEDFGDKVTYTNINEKSGFVAVYAGETEAEAPEGAGAGEGRGLSGREPSAHGSDRRVSDRVVSAPAPIDLRQHVRVHLFERRLENHHVTV